METEPEPEPELELELELVPVFFGFSTGADPSGPALPSFAAAFSEMLESTTLKTVVGQAVGPTPLLLLLPLPELVLLILLSFSEVPDPDPDSEPAAAGRHFVAGWVEDEAEAEEALALALAMAGLVSTAMECTLVMIRALLANSSKLSMKSLPASSFREDSGNGMISKHLITWKMCISVTSGFQSLLRVFTHISPFSDTFGWNILVKK